MKLSYRLLMIAAMMIGGPAMAETFSGFLVGVQAGAVKRSGLLRFSGASLKGSETDVAVGGFAGYDLRIGKAVIGVQGEINNGAGTFSQNDGAGTFNTVDPRWGYALSARAGFVATPNLLIYGRAGYAAERYKEIYGGPTIAVLVPPPPPKWKGGLMLGGGAEVAVTKRITVRAEYRHNDYRRGTSFKDGRYDADQLLAGVAFHF